MRVASLMQLEPLAGGLWAFARSSLHEFLVASHVRRQVFLEVAETKKATGKTGCTTGCKRANLFVAASLFMLIGRQKVPNRRPFRLRLRDHTDLHCRRRVALWRVHAYIRIVHFSSMIPGRAVPLLAKYFVIGTPTSSCSKSMIDHRWLSVPVRLTCPFSQTPSRINLPSP